jgi:crotonobetainyl-CoA:carnitine CoA-transferase CaiB-like acyl-CoA transferase
VVEVDDRSGGKLRMPGAPWRFGDAVLPAPGLPYFQGESNEDVLQELGWNSADIDSLQASGILRSRRSATGAFD